MKFRKKIIVSTFMLIIILANIINPYLIAGTNYYQASIAFNNGLGLHGKDQWYYMQYDGSNYSYLNWSNQNQKWYGSQTYLAITGSTMHPESNFDAVRKWVAPCNGTARVHGNVRKSDVGGGDGVYVLISKNGTTVWGVNYIAYNDSTGLNYDFNLTLNAGDSIYFRVNRFSNIYHDSVNWDPLIDFTPLPDNSTVKNYAFSTSTDGWNSPWNCTIQASGGYLNGTVTGSSPCLYSPDNINSDITKNCIIKIKMKNSTSSTWAAVYFTTTQDTNWTQAKCKAFNIIPNDSNYTEYTIDMSGYVNLGGSGGPYGWIGKLKQIRINPVGDSSSGSFSIDYIKLNSGGTDVPPFSLMDSETVYDNYTLKTTLNLNYWPDSTTGVIRNSDASYKFISSQGGATQCTTLTGGTIDNPAGFIIGRNINISGTPSIFGYVSAGPSYVDPNDSSTIMTFLHLERHYTIGSSHYYYASIGIAISRNAGSTWTWCGEIIRPDVAYNSSTATSYDIGGGSFIIKNIGGEDYFYLYSIDHDVNSLWLNGLSVSRAPVTPVLNAAKNNTVTSWYKYYNGSWTQPGLNGSFTNIFRTDMQMNFMSIAYNSYISKYVLAYTCTDQYSTNYGDLSLVIANSEIDFTNNSSQYIIQPSTKMVQYPTILGLGNANPQYETQKNFYIYYTQWENDQYWTTDTNLRRIMVVLD